MEFSEKGPMDPMNGHFSSINGLESVNGVQFSLCGILTNLIFAHKEMHQSTPKNFELCYLIADNLLSLFIH